MQVTSARRLILSLTLAAGTAIPLFSQTLGESTDAERQRLLKTVTDQGADALRRTLPQPEVGSLEVNNGLGCDLHFARQEAGRRRPTSFAATRHPQTCDARSRKKVMRSMLFAGGTPSWRSMVVTWPRW